MQTFRYVRHQPEKPEKLLEFLCRRFPYNNQKVWKEAIAGENISVNSTRASDNQILITGDLISYLRPREEEPEVDTHLPVLFEDEDILIVQKNANIPISESGRYYQNTLIHILKERRGDDLYPVHRLDRETSGLLVVAKSVESARELGKAFSQGQTRKEYHAILRGEVNFEDRLVDEPIGKDKEKTILFIRQAVIPEGKKAQTRFVTVLKNEGISFVKILLYTGRTHQIRCHAEFIGHPILGDKIYGRADEEFLEFVRQKKEPYYPGFGEISRQLLHASYLGFPHPRTGKDMEFYSDPRPEFYRFPKIEQICKNSEGRDAMHCVSTEPTNQPTNRTGQIHGFNRETLKND